MKFNRCKLLLILILGFVFLIVYVLLGRIDSEMVDKTTIQKVDERLYFPLARRGQNKVGVEWDTKQRNVEAWYIDKSPLRVSCRWSDVEQIPGVYDWSTCDAKFGDYRPYLLTLKMTPEWARDWWRPLCSLPKRDHWEAFAVFVDAAHKRYRPEYIELWNEPDARAEDMPDSHKRHYGCLGPDLGAYYGEFVEYVAQHTNVKIAAGAVSNIESNFVTDLLETASSFEVLTFHCYAKYYGFLFEPCVSQYRQAESYWPLVMLSETAVYYSYGSEAGYYQAQIDHFNELVSQLSTPWFWFTLVDNGWPLVMSTDMIASDNVPRPVYYEYVRHYE